MSLSRGTRMVTTSSLIFILGLATLFLGGFAGTSDPYFTTGIGVIMILVVTGVTLFFEEVEVRSSASKVREDE